MVYGAIKKDTYHFFFIGFAAFLGFYAFLYNALISRGILHPDLMLFSEKALLVLRGFPPRFENFGFLHPPLPIFLISLFNGNLFMAQTFTAAAISAATALHIRKTTPTFKQALPLIIYLVFSFPILFVAIQRFDLYLYFFVLVLSARFLYRYKKEGRSSDLFLAGPVFAFAFLIHFSSLYLLPMFFILICLLYRDQPQIIMPVSFTFFTPFLVAFFVFASINLLFTGQALGFLMSDHRWASPTDIETAVASGSLVQGMIYVARYLFLLLPILLPYGIGLRYQCSPLLLLPFMVLLAFVYAHLSSPAIYLLAIFMVYTLVMTEWREPVKHKVLFPLLWVSLLMSSVAAFFSTEPHERNVIHAFFETGQAERNLEPFSKMAERLKKTQGKILLDDTDGYPLVYLMNDLERFILPYQYEFAVALSNPEPFVDYAVAIKNKRSDLVFEKFKTPVKAFRKQFENEIFIVWERIT